MNGINIVILHRINYLSQLILLSMNKSFVSSNLIFRWRGQSIRIRMRIFYFIFHHFLCLPLCICLNLSNPEFETLNNPHENSNSALKNNLVKERNFQGRG